MLRKCINIFAQAFVFTLIYVSVSYAQHNSPVNFSADRLEHDDTNQIITAHGDVELIQDQQILHADQITYELQTDIVTAIGNVSLLDENGHVHFADYLQLRNNMKEGFITALSSHLEDGSRFTAAEAVYVSNERTVMKEASFTPCKVCIGNPDKRPTWQIKAEEVTYYEEEGRVGYKNARLELLGVPLAYTPVFSHPDPRIKQRSGFLRPGIGWDSELGGYVTGRYYWAIGETKDATLGVQPTDKQGVLFIPEYRQHFENGYINVTPSFALNSDRTNLDNSIDEKQIRGHLQGEGRFDLNDQWRAGFDAKRSSDKEYLRLYNISDDNVLQNIAYVERFDNRNYSNINVQHYQDVRLGDRPEQPDVLPSMSHSMIGAPSSFLDGRLALDVSALGLRRSNDAQDVNRLSSELSWQHNHIANSGLAFENTLSGRLDYYYAKDIDNADIDPTLEESISKARFFPQLHSQVSYPLVKNADDKHYLIEPRLSFTTGYDSNKDIIPNEDSRDVQLDALNIFESSRFPGQDIQDSSTRVTYGLGGGVHYHNGARIRSFIGQSYSFDDESIYPDGSGLSDNYSDYVASVGVDLFNPNIFLDYRTQIAEHNFQPRRHELQANARFGRLNMNTRYTFTRAVEGTGFEDSREQVNYGFSYRLTDNWSVQAASLYDLGEEPGLRRGSTGFTYTDDCFTFNILGTRSITNRSTGESQTSLIMRFGFKYLGEIQAPQILLAEERLE